MPPRTLEFLGVPPVVQVHDHGLELIFLLGIYKFTGHVQRRSASPDDTYHLDHNTCQRQRDLPCWHDDVAFLGATSRHLSYSRTIQARPYGDSVFFSNCS